MAFLDCGDFICAFDGSFVLFTSPKPIVAEIKEGETSRQRSTIRWWWCLACFCSYMWVGEIGFSNWIFTYATRTGLASVAQADKITSVFWGALTIGRLVSIGLAKS